MCLPVNLRYVFIQENVDFKCLKCTHKIAIVYLFKCEACGKSNQKDKSRKFYLTFKICCLYLAIYIYLATTIFARLGYISIFPVKCFTDMFYFQCYCYVPLIIGHAYFMLWYADWFVDRVCSLYIVSRQ